MILLRQGKSPLLVIPAAVSLAVFVWLLTLHPTSAGRTYAAYGGVYIAVAIAAGRVAGRSQAKVIGDGMSVGGLEIDSTQNHCDAPEQTGQLSDGLGRGLLALATGTATTPTTDEAITPARNRLIVPPRTDPVRIESTGPVWSVAHDLQQGAPMTTRRGLVTTAAGLLLARAAAAAPKREEAQIGPAEDLMREHGVLRRVMFLYDEAAHRLEAGEKAPLNAVAAGAEIVRRVIEQYHEKLEEEFIFPRMEKAKKLTKLTATLRRQHEAGRAVTAGILQQCRGGDGKALSQLLRSFNRMYRPHAAREDTLLIPAFHDLVGEKTYRELGEMFEAEETKQLGHEGFEGAVAQVGKLEEQFGLADLDQFTPVSSP